jgi:hypothetical protein
MFSRRLLEALPTEFDWDLICGKMDNDENKTRVQIWRWCYDITLQIAFFATTVRIKAIIQMERR